MFDTIIVIEGRLLHLCLFAWVLLKKIEAFSLSSNMAPVRKKRWDWLDGIWSFQGKFPLSWKFPLFLIWFPSGAEMFFNRQDIAEHFHNNSEQELQGCEGHPIACYYQNVYKTAYFYWVLGDILWHATTRGSIKTLSSTGCWGTSCGMLLPEGLLKRSVLLGAGGHPVACYYQRVY